jgi:hypothetical protein
MEELLVLESEHADGKAKDRLTDADLTSLTTIVSKAALYPDGECSMAPKLLLSIILELKAWRAS